MSERRPGIDVHPKGLYVLFAAEMWERFSFYSMLALFTLYLQDPVEGFGWSKAEATTLYSQYLMFVYASPIIGGPLADWKLGYRRSVMIGALFFIAGHLLLSFHSVPIMYTALACLVVGNGFFKPNVSTMVGNLYPEGSPLKERAYSIFYVGINVGAFLGPIVVEVVKQKINVHAAFATAAVGMVFSVAVLAIFRKHLAGVEHGAKEKEAAAEPQPIDKVSDNLRITALVVVFATVIVFWMAFHQNGSTMTYFADNNTDWKSWGVTASGTLSNAINPAFILLFTFPLIGLWRRLAKRGVEPSTPTKMAIGMFLTGMAYVIMSSAGRAGGDAGMVSPGWLFGSYAVITLGELMVSPMGLSLVSKVAPLKRRGLMMGGWFAATAIGNELTMIGVYWDRWLHSSFFLLLALICLGMSVVLFGLLKPLKRWMPGV